MDLYKQVVSPDEHPEGQGERLHPDLPIYANREARLFAYWDHEPRMPWQTEAYYASQKRVLRPGTYLRLHENKWASAEEIFISASLWDPCIVRTPLPAFTGPVQQIVADPYQLHRSITTLKNASIPIKEFPQTQANCTLMGQTLFDLLLCGCQVATPRMLLVYPFFFPGQERLAAMRGTAPGRHTDLKCAPL